MSVRSEILDQFKQVAHEQDKRLGPLSDELPLMDSGLDSLCFAIIVSRAGNRAGRGPIQRERRRSLPRESGRVYTLL